MKKLFALASLTALLSGCATTTSTTSALQKTPPAIMGAGPAVGAIDRSISAHGQEDRIQFLILHYTAIDQATSLRVLSQQEVSAHYLVGNDDPVTVWQLVDEKNMAYHAGLSDWKGYSRLNASSIGIEIVNLGYKDTPEGRVYYPFPQAQIDRVIALVKDIVTRHHIRPEYILAHAEIAPQRKPDPGPLFPWKQLADAGLITWPDEATATRLQQVFETNPPDIQWYQQQLARIGYAVPQTGVLDEATKNVLIAFQTKYRPMKFDGQPDAQTASLIAALLAKMK